MSHVRTEAALLHVLGDGEIVFLMNEVEHVVDGLAHFLLLGFGISGSPIFKDVVEVLLLVGLHVKGDAGGQGFDKFQLLQHRLGETIDVSQHVLIDATGGFGHDDEVVVIEIDAMAEVVDGLLDELRQGWMVLEVLCELDILDEGGSDGTFHLLREFIAIVETLAKSFYLIAVTRQMDNVLRAVVLEIETEGPLLCIKLYAHIFSKIYDFKGKGRDVFCIGQENGEKVGRGKPELFYFRVYGWKSR